jgi:hypothetical protein
MNSLQTNQPYRWEEKRPRFWIDSQKVCLSHTRDVFISAEAPLPRFVAKIETAFRRDKSGDKRPCADEFAYKVCKLFSWSIIPKTKILHKSSISSKYSPLMRPFLEGPQKKTAPCTFTFQEFIKGCTLYDKRQGSFKVVKMLPDLHSFQKAQLLTLLLGCRDARDDNIMFNKKTGEVFLVDNEHIGEKCTLSYSYLKYFTDLTVKEISPEILDAFLLVTPDQLLKVRKKYEAKDQELMALWAEEFPPTLFDEFDMKILNTHLDNIDSNFRLLQEGIKSLRKKNTPITLISLEKELHTLPSLTPAPPVKPEPMPLCPPAKTAPIPIASKRKENPIWFEELLNNTLKACQPPQEIIGNFNWNLSPPSPGKKSEEPLEEIGDFNWGLWSGSPENESPEKKTWKLEGNPENFRKCLQSENPFSFCFPLKEDEDFSWARQKNYVYTPMEYAIKIGDLESLQFLLDRLPSFPDSLPFFYMECLQEKIPANLGILRLLLSRMSDINVERDPRFNGNENLLDFAISNMARLTTLHTHVIEELFKQGAKVLKSKTTTPFKQLKSYLINQEENPLAMVVQVAFSPNKKIGSIICLEKTHELFLKRLHQYVELEKKYDPQPTSHLTLKEFKEHQCELEHCFQAIQFFSQALNLQAHNRLVFQDSKLELTPHLAKILQIFYHKIVAHSLFFNTLVIEGKFEDCFKKKQIQDLRQAFTNLIKLYPLEGNGYLGKIGASFLPGMYNSKIKV